MPGAAGECESCTRGGSETARAPFACVDEMNAREPERMGSRQEQIMAGQDQRDLRQDTAAAVFALRQILMKIIAEQPDPAAVTARVTARGCRIIVDEGSGLIAFGTFADDGQPLWIESVLCDPRDQATFGRTSADLAATPARLVN